MRSPILDQYHATVKHKEPFSRCGPLWRSLFWRQPWQGPQGWLSLPGDTDGPADPGGSLSCAGGGRAAPGRAGIQPDATCELEGCGAPGAGLSPPRPRDRPGPLRPSARFKQAEMEIPTRALGWKARAGTRASPSPGGKSWQGHPFSHQVVHLI